MCNLPGTSARRLDRVGCSKGQGFLEFWRKMHQTRCLAKFFIFFEDGLLCLHKVCVTSECIQKRTLERVEDVGPLTSEGVVVRTRERTPEILICPSSKAKPRRVGPTTSNPILRFRIRIHSKRVSPLLSYYNICSYCYFPQDIVI